MLIGFAACELRGFQFPAVMHQPQGGDAEGDMGGIQPVMRDGRGGIILAGQPVHIGGGTQRRFARIAGINKEAVGVVETVAVGGGQLHQQIMGMLAIHQRRDAIGGFAGRQQQRIAAPADKGIQADHGAQAQRIVMRELARRHHHAHAAFIGHGRAARAGLAVENAAHPPLQHHHPGIAEQAGHLHDAAHRGGLWLPACAGGFARHGIRTKRGLAHIHIGGHGHAAHAVAHIHFGHTGHVLRGGGHHQQQCKSREQEFPHQATVAWREKRKSRAVEPPGFSLPCDESGF